MIPSRQGRRIPCRPTAALCAFVTLALAGQAVPLRAQAENVTVAPKGTLVAVDDIERTWPSLTPFQQFAVIDQLVGAGEIGRAEHLLARTDYARTNDRATKRFYIGLIRRGQGRSDEAVAIFREILADNPGFSRVRMALATTLYQSEDDEAARYNLELVLADTATNPDLANTVRSYIGAIDGRRRWDATGYVSIAPSTNFNQGSDAATVYLTGPDGTALPFELSKDNRKQSGIGLAAGLQASYRQPLGDSLDLIASGAIHSKTYRDSDYNDSLFSASLGPRLRFPWGYLGVYGLVEERLYANEPFSFSWGALVSATVRLGTQDIVFADVSCLKRDVADDWNGADLSYQDGHTCSVGGRYEHAFASTTVMRLLGSYGRERTGRESLDYDSWSAGAGLAQELPWGMSIYLQAQYTNRDYDGIYFDGKARRDDRWDLSFNLTKRDWVLFGMAPMVQYTYTLNDSNIPFHAFDAHGVNLTLTQRF